MAISPNDFSLWARLTGNKYPSTPAERAKKGPEVHNFIQNLDKEGMLGGKEAKEPKKEKNLAEKVATGALIAGGVAAAIAAGRDPRVQNVAKKAASATRTKIDDFLSNIGGPRVIDRDIVDASYDVTPEPSQQQSNVALTQKSLPEGPSLIQRIEQKRAEMVDSFKPAVTGETFQTSGAISGDNIYGDIGDAKLRARRTFGPTIDALKEIDPGRKDLGRMGNKMLTQAQQDRDFDLAYIIARNKGLDDTNAVRLARETAGFDGSATIGKPTEYRELLGTLKTSSPIKPRVDDLLKLVEPGPQINLPESVQEPGALVQLAAGSTPSNKVPTMGATIGGSSLTDKHATKMAVDNALDNVRAKLTGTPVPITGVRIEGPSNVQKSGPGVVVDKEGNVVGDANYRSGQRELPIIYSTERETNQQMRRIEPTAEQSIAIRQEQGEVSKDRKGNMMITSPTYDSLTGFKTPSSETVASTPLEERIGRLESKTAELRAIQENLSRAGELMSSGLDPRTTRFDSARAAGLTSRSGITPRITNPKFQENVNLGRTQEAALPKESQRVFFEQDESGKVIPQSVQLRDERQVVTGPDTKTRGIAGGYVGKEGQGFIERRGKFDNMPEKEMASSIGPYGVEAGNFPRAKISQTPTESPMSFTQAPGRAKQPIDIVVSGGRGGQNKFDMPGGGGYQQFKSEMDNIIGQMGIPEGKTINIISGGATGVDSYAARYAGEKRFKGGNFTSEVIEADWTKGGTLPPPLKGQKPVRGVNFDPAAGPVRNQKMIDKAEAAIVFDGGKGTEDFIGQAQKEQAERRFPIFKASEVQKATPESKERFDVAREVTRFLTDQSIPPEKRVLNEQARNELIERVRNRRALNLPTNLKESPFFYQNGD